MDQVLNKNWGFKLSQGDLDGYPDIGIFIEFSTVIDDEDKKTISKIFEDWYNKGVEVEDKESEFGGVMHFMHEPEFVEDAAQFSFDLGTVEAEPAFLDLAQKLSEWNKSQSNLGKANIVKVSLGYDPELSEKIYALPN